LRFYPVGSTGYVDVRDVSRIAVNLMEQGRTGERFVVNAEDVFYRDLFQMIADAYGKRPPSVRVSKPLSDIAWRLESVRSALTGKAPRLTRETAATSSKEWRYDASMSVEATGINYIPIVESIGYWAAVLEPELRQRGASL
jgi:nucleoside-diphosphate-sugar epimerase